MVLRKMIKNTCPKSSYKPSFETSRLFSHGACTFRAMIVHQRPLRTIYDTLPLTNYTLLTADIFLRCKNILFPIDHFRFLFHIKKLPSPALTVARLSHLTSYTPTKSNLYLANSLAASVRETVLYSLQHSTDQISCQIFVA